MSSQVDCVVVGAGPAGLAPGTALTVRVGETWRTQRWDSFRLNTPARANTMLGEQARDEYPTGAEVVGRLGKLAAGAPVREGVHVSRLASEGDGYVLHTGHGT